MVALAWHKTCIVWERQQRGAEDGSGKKMAKMIKLENSFHGTSILVRVQSADLLREDPYLLTKSQKATVRRIRKQLCGIKNCQCGIVR